MLSAAMTAAEEPRRVYFLPSRVQFVPDSEFVTYYVKVPLDGRNRTLTVAALDGEFPVRSSEQDLSAERRRTIWDYRWRLPPGELVLVAVVREAGGRIAGRDERRVTVYHTLSSITQNSVTVN